MPERTSYEHGVPSWIDLTTTDTADAKRFYTGLFGWQFEDMPAGDAGVYTMWRQNGRDVAGMGEQPPAQAARGVPPFWLTYVSVVDLDTACAAVTEAGGNVHAPPMQVMDAGRMAVIADPAGAVFAMWEAGNHKGAGIVNEPVSLTWNELTVPDVSAVADFYSSVFGWRAVTDTERAGPAYTTFFKGDDYMCGAMDIQKEWGEVPPHWLVYFAVADVDAIVAEAGVLGGKVVVPPMDIPPGRFAQIADPQGAMCAVIALSANL